MGVTTRPRCHSHSGRLHVENGMTAFSDEVRYNSGTIATCACFLMRLPDD